MSRGIISFLNAPCRHCATLQDSHADGKQCLFRSSTYDPESRDRLQLVAKACRFPGSVYTPGYLRFAEATPKWAASRYWACTTWRDGNTHHIIHDQYVPYDVMDR